MKAVAALVLAGGVWATALAQAPGVPLFVVPTENASNGVARAGALRVSLYTRDPGALARTLGTSVPAAAADRLEYVVDAYPQLDAGPERTWRESTFVIDHDEPAVVRVGEELRRAHGDRPSRAELVAFVAGAVKGTFGRGWDLASRVATRREGDCSEYAVLTAALARGLQRPARVVVGVALVAEETRYGAYGHAWAELLDDGRWVVADAALHGTNGVRYIPYGVLTDEGPGYALGLVRLSGVWLQRLVVLGPATPR